MTGYRGPAVLTGPDDLNLEVIADLKSWTDPHNDLGSWAGYLSAEGIDPFWEPFDKQNNDLLLHVEGRVGKIIIKHVSPPAPTAEIVGSGPAPFGN